MFQPNQPNHISNGSQQKNRQSILRIVLGIVVGLATWAVPFYLLFLRPRLLRWGTTQAEQAEPLPGDEIIASPNHVWTRAIDIAAPPAAVWPWLVQMGQGRGGLYSYDWLENLAGCDVHSVDEILPELQTLGVGDEVRLVKPNYPVDLALEVACLEPEAALVLRAKDTLEAALAAGMPYLSWAFVLRPHNGGTRLIVRTRSTYARTGSSLFWNRYGLEPVQFIMERKMMLGIKGRAEGLQWEMAGEREPATLLDQILPEYEFRGEVSLPVDAPAEAIFRALDEVTLDDMPLARFLGELRYLPARLIRKMPERTDTGVTFKEQILAFGNIVLAESPGREVVIGVAGKFHQLQDQAPVHFNTPEQFHRFCDPAYQKLGQSFRVTPNPAGSGNLLTLEHRTHGLSAESRRAFSFYWLLIGPMGNFVTRLLLKAVKARAEAMRQMGVAV